MVQVSLEAREVILAHCFEEYPLEACGMLIGSDNRVLGCYPTHNLAGSARVFIADPQDVAAAHQRAESEGHRLIGVYHSHTNSEAFPSRTDVRQAPDSSWIYVIVSLARPLLEMRAFTISSGLVNELALTGLED